MYACMYACGSAYMYAIDIIFHSRSPRGFPRSHTIEKKKKRKNKSVY